MTSSIKFKILTKPTELNLNLTLQSGQSFRWNKISTDTWRGALGHHVWTLQQEKNYIKCHVTSPVKHSTSLKQIDFEKRIKNYFRLDVCLTDLYKKWSLSDSNFAKVANDFQGIRILNQDPMENVFSFICSSNNNIERISKLVTSLSREFGEWITEIDGEDFYAFPTPADLAKNGTEEKLRKLSFGYRAKYIEESARLICKNGGESWLQGLSQLEYKECHNQIIQLPGVGPKVADCICLMSMNHLNAIPVDTHVFQIAVRDYLPHLKEKKSVTTKVYDEIADYFRDVFGPSAGWAHSVLFTADLRKFKPTKPSKGKKRPCSDI